MNGLYEIHHRAAERQVIVFLALAAIVMAAKKEIFHWVTVIYAIAATGITLWYQSIYVDYLAMTEWDVKILRWGMAAVILGGFLIVNMIVQLVRLLVKKKPVQMSLWFGAILALFFVLIIFFRNTRWWPVAMVAAYVLFYIRYALWDKKAYFLQNLCNGLLLHFVCSMVFCFVRRPFLSWVYPRYPFTFHTVTITAVYLTFVVCAALMKLVDKYKEWEKDEEIKGTDIWKKIWKELLLFGMSATYLLFTASRTGFLAVAMMFLVVIILLATDKGKSKVKRIGIWLGTMMIAVVWCFPMVFTAQRVLPAVCDNVFKHEVEVFPDAITRGNEWDSMYYITVGRFAEVFNNKIFGIPESGTGAYERSEEYQKYKAKRFNSKGDVVWPGSVEDMYAEENGTENAETGNTTDTTENTDTVPTEEQKLNIIGIKTEEERAAEEAAAEEREKEAAEGNFEVEEAVEEEVKEDTSVYEKTEEYANGRMDIFRAYLEQMNLNGHDEMGAILPDGSLAVHAHNIYLQVAYDHGLIVGVLFVVVGVAAFVQGCIYYKRKKNEVSCAAMPAAAVAAFAMAGLVEWIFHLCHPAGLVLMLVLAPLLFDMGGKRKKADERK